MQVYCVFIKYYDGMDSGNKVLIRIDVLWKQENKDKKIDKKPLKNGKIAKIAKFITVKNIYKKIPLLPKICIIYFTTCRLSSIPKCSTPGNTIILAVKDLWKLILDLILSLQEMNFLPR